MKNLILFAIIFLVVLSCAVPESDEFEFNNPEFNNMQEACEWINQNIKYKSDYYDYWKLPQETLDDKNGDCEDQALLLMGIMKYQKGYNSELIIVQIDSTTSHAIVKYNDKYYDCTNGTSSGKTNYKITNVYSYNDAMYTAKYLKNY